MVAGADHKQPGRLHHGGLLPEVPKPSGLNPQCGTLVRIRRARKYLKIHIILCGIVNNNAKIVVFGFFGFD